MSTLLQNNPKSDSKIEPLPYVLPFSAISASDLPYVGGKGANLGEMSGAGFPVPPYLAAGFMARLLLERMTLGYTDPNDLEALVRGLSGNVTTEMDLEVGDLADVARQSPALVAHLSQHDVMTVLETAAKVEGGPAFLAAWQGFMTRYEMRGPSEIDISRKRWREDPSSLLQVIIGNLRDERSGAHRQKHQKLMAEGEAAGEASC